MYHLCPPPDSVSKDKVLVYCTFYAHPAMSGIIADGVKLLYQLFIYSWHILQIKLGITTGGKLLVIVAPVGSGII